MNSPTPAAPTVPALPVDTDRALRLLSLAAFASMASMRWCDSLLPALSAEFASTPGQTARVIAAFAIAYGVMQLVYGPLGDRLGKFRIISFAVLACTVGALASAVAPGLGWLTVARGLNGAAAAGVIPLAMAWIGDHFPWEQRQPALARLMGATIAGMIFGQWVSGLFADLLGWRAGFVLLALMFASAALFLRAQRGAGEAPAPAVPNGQAPGAISSWSRMREVLVNRVAQRLLLLVAVEGAFAFSAMAFAPSHLHGRFGLPVSWAGAILALYGVGGLMYSRHVHWWLSKLPPMAMARTGGVLAGVAWLLAGWAPAWAWSLPLCMLAGLGFYMIHNTLQTLATQMVPTQRGTAVSLFACALFLGQSMGMAGVAWLVDRLTTGPVMMLCGAGLIGVGLCAPLLARPAVVSG